MSEEDLNNATYVKLLSKALTGIISLCVAMSIGISGFALKEAHASSLMLRELTVRMSTVESSTSVNSSRYEDILSLKVEVGGIKDGVSDIKDSLKELARKKD